MALGLKEETADMYHWESEGKIYTYVGQMGDPNGIPAWSLHRLIEMMPMTFTEDRVYHERWDLNITPIMVLYRNQDQPDEWIGECLGQGMYNNIIDCIAWLIKEGYFNKEYLV